MYTRLKETPDNTDFNKHQKICIMIKFNVFKVKLIVNLVSLASPKANDLPHDQWSVENITVLCVNKMKFI